MFPAYRLSISLMDAALLISLGFNETKVPKEGLLGMESKRALELDNLSSNPGPTT